MKMKTPFGLTAVLLAAILHTACAAPPRVEVSKRQLRIDGQPYVIRGVCYHPVPKGQTQRDFGSLAGDLKIMKEAGVNTLRVYAPIDDVAVLDAIRDAGMKVIIGFGYNQGGTNDILSGSFIDYVNKHKEHAAILMWELGNEYNYHPEWFGGDIQTWYTALNNAAARIHEADPARPVATAHGELPNERALARCPNVDVWGMNVYRWDDPGKLFKEWKRASDKPMYLSEAGADAYMTISKQGYEKGPNQKAQADATAGILESVFKHTDICSGVAVFSFTDGWWKAGNPDAQDPGGAAPNSSGVPYDGAANEEYWGIVDIDRNKRAAFDVVKNKFAEAAEKGKSE